MDWEAPIPVWIESINIDMDEEVPVSDLMTPESTKLNSFISSCPAKSKATATPTAKPARRPRRKVDVDPVGGKQHRKDKQRGYEKGYRSRKKTQSQSDKVEWMQLEMHIRQILTKRTSAVVLGSLDERKAESSTVSIRQRYLELLQEERGLREAEAFDSCFFAELQAMMFWGGATKSSRDIREQMNGLSRLRECQMFEFSW
ncbi:hypothetical protein PHMEG_00030073 [Phytophthora megakarya]|uniref:Uncharacterized protein n=1 Tax=Phytophthora megakarya TaxID=4795 RepID=A0A225V207_9STRA|nr:hypothetical protein PHMEG_00030073 [Phytophthora megakarya]